MKIHHTPRRSLLFVPASNARALEKARGLASDVVIIDLEDSVAPSVKELARNQAAQAIKQGFNGREVVLRINGADSPWIADDLALVVASSPHAMLVPKVASAQMLRTVTQRLNTLGAPIHIRVWAMIETARAVLDADAIARTAHEPESRLDLFLLGTNDLLRETGARPVQGRMPLLPWLQSVLLAARASGLAVIDAVYNDFSDTIGFTSECEQGRDLGFDGKSLIHPSQIEIANAVFGPSENDIVEAKGIIAAFTATDNADRGAVTYKGRMIEELHVSIARRTLAMSEAIQKRYET